MKLVLKAIMPLVIDARAAIEAPPPKGIEPLGWARTKAICASALALAAEAACRPTLAEADLASGAAAATPAATRPAADVSSGGQTETKQPYPKARWRLGNWNDLQRVALWGAHILIRHESSSSNYVFSPAEGFAAPPTVRSRDDAAKIAEDLARSARRAPDDFARLAREHSEDYRTARLGGVLGTLMASQLLPWPSVLDTFASLRPGEVSEVVETNYGFHVFQRLPPPPKETVTGAHIVIGHNDVPSLARLLGRATVNRSRQEAHRLAGEVLTAASTNASAFSALVKEYSEHPDALRGGDFGMWSTQEPTPQGANIELLRQLDVGELAGPIDTPYGYQIVQRQPNRPRQRYAVDAVELAYDATAADTDPQSRPTVLQLAESLIEEIKTRPGRFLDYQREHCCMEPLVWTDGRGTPQLANAVEDLAVGALVTAPVDTGFSLYVVRRIEPPLRERQPPQFELPAPDAPDFAFLAAYRDTSWVREQLARVAEKSEALTLGLPEAQRIAFLALHREQTGLDELVAPEQRVDAFLRMQHATAELLGKDIYPRYRAILNLHFENEIIGMF